MTFSLVVNYLKLTSFSSSRWASRTFKIMSSVKPWKLTIKDSCLSISVSAPKTMARVDPTSSDKFSKSSLKTSLQNKNKVTNYYISPLSNSCILVDSILCCANKDHDGSLGPFGKFIEYCRIVWLPPVIPLDIMNNW